MNYRFTNLLGAPYRGGTLALAGDTLFTPVGNRVGTVRRGVAGRLVLFFLSVTALSSPRQGRF